MISIIIPTHNRAASLTRAVNSVRNQEYKDFELIVVSDGSTDETDAIMKDYTEKDRRIKYCHYMHAQGANHARNVGVMESSGEYIAFLDDDDEWHPTKLTKQLQVFEGDKRIGLVYSAIRIIIQDKGIQYLSIPEASGDLSREILFHNCIKTTSSVMLKRNVFELAGGFDEKLPAMQDYDLWIRCLQITEVGCIREPLVNYYVSDKSNQISSYTDKYITAMEIIDEKYRVILDSLTKNEYRIRNADKYADLAKISLKNKSTKQCRTYCVKSIQSKPNLYAIKLYIASFLDVDFVMRILQSYRGK